MDEAVSGLESELGRAAESARGHYARAEHLERAVEELRKACGERDGRMAYLEAELDLSRSAAESRERGLAALGAELEALKIGSRAQASRIRLAALREAAEVSERARRLGEAKPASAERLLRSLERAIDRIGAEFEAAAGAGERTAPADASAADAADAINAAFAAAGSGETAAAPVIAVPQAESSANGGGPGAAGDTRAATGGQRRQGENRVRVDIGPFRDFSQLVSFEDAANAIGATGEISIRRFSEGRADIDVELTEPADLLRELEERCDLEFEVRARDEDEIILDLGE